MRLLTEEFERRAKAADDVAVIDDEGEHSSEALADASETLAKQMTEAGLTAPTVLVQAENSWRTVAAALAVGRVGGVIALMSNYVTAAEFEAAHDDIRPDVLLADSPTLDIWGARTVFPAVNDVDAMYRQRLLSTVRSDRPDRWSGGAVIGMTSGSTGRAKGVVQSEAALRYACTRMIDTIGLEADDPVAGVVPLSSIAAFCFGLYLPLLVGSPVIYWSKWEPQATVRRMAERDARWTMCVPTMALQLAAAAADTPGILDCVRAMTVGGGPMDQEALGRAEKVLGTRILRVFGMSECLGHTTPDVDDGPNIRLGRDGRPFEGTEVRAVDERGRPLPAGKVGRAQVRGPSLFLGYAREGAVDPPDLTDDGFFETGDLVRVNEDDTISVMGREKDVIIRGGRNIDIAEVEMAIASHPQVAQVCVVPVPDEMLGERIAALVILESGHLDRATVNSHLQRRGLAKTKWPEFVLEVDAIPQTRVGKTSRRDAADLARRLISNA